MEIINWPTLVLGGMMAGLVFIASTLLGLAAAVYVLLRLPPDYFLCNGSRNHGAGIRRPVKLARHVLKNSLGVTLALTGGLLSLPGIPGPGLVMLLLGITLTDIPGKGRLLGWLLGRPAILVRINRLRQRHGKPPMLLAKPGCVN